MRLISSIKVNLPDNSRFTVAWPGEHMPVPLTPGQFVEWAKERSQGLAEKLGDINSNAIRIVRINYIKGDQQDLPLENGLITKDNRPALGFLMSETLHFLY